MSNAIPPIIQQMIDTVKDKQTQEFVRFNTITSLERIKEAIELTIKKYKK